MKATDLFVRCLEEERIEYIFGIPGEENADFMMSLEKSDSIKFILTRHEQGAAFMAEIYGRLTGNPAGCLGTLGPGATNLLTGVADGGFDVRVDRGVQDVGAAIAVEIVEEGVLPASMDLEVLEFEFRRFLAEESQDGRSYNRDHRYHDTGGML